MFKFNKLFIILNYEFNFNPIKLNEFDIHSSYFKK